MRRALVTGGASPLGEAICRQLAADGVHVIVPRPQQHGPRRAPGRANFTAEAVGCDITSVAATEAALAPILAAGPVQILCAQRRVP